ncbi:hypothetical protein RAS1_26270 [Phycisphaerae bacterium RAS1]|nr:hypothetical protein RAS1_26270 [Phycisphaerae bacterium RAS1]
MQGKVTSVGFPSKVNSGLLIREGQWFPIAMQLATPGSEPVQVDLRCEGADIDGDRVRFLERGVTITPDAGPKRAWCYAVKFRTEIDSASAANSELTVDLIAADGGVVQRIALPPFETLDNQTMLVLDISEQPIVKLNTLETPRWAPYDSARGRRPYYRNVCISQMASRDLPDRWIGLESVDLIVWDRPNPSGTSIAQIDALKTWVRNGGQLLIGLGTSWPLLQRSALADILPFEGQGGTIETQSLELFFSRMVESEVKVREFVSLVTIATPQLSPTAVPLGNDRANGQIFTMAAARFVGSGRVMAVAASLRDLTSAPVNATFWSSLLDLNPLTRKFRENEESALQQLVGLTGSEQLFSGVVRPADFSGVSSVFVAAAFIFVSAYILLATVASWTWLKRYQLTAISWTVFAAFAVAGSALGLGTVSVTRGLSQGVQSSAIVDLEAGSPQARARAWIGYGSGARQNVDLSLSGEGAYLRAMARGPRQESTYATAGSYDVSPQKGTLSDVPLRATLKQFEGFWSGDVGGVINAQITLDRSTGYVSPQSWIENGLRVPLLGGVLLFIDPRFEQVPPRISGQTRNWRNRDPVPPAMNVLALPVPALQAGDRTQGQLGAAAYARAEQALARWIADGAKKPDERPDLLSLWRMQQSWGGNLGAPPDVPIGLENAQAKAALLLSTYNLHLHNASETNLDSIGKPVSLDGLVNCDITHWLTRGQGILLLAADHPGPVQLERDGKPLRARSGFSLYRVRVPVSYTGAPPRPDAAEAP